MNFKWLNLKIKKPPEAIYLSLHQTARLPPVAEAMGDTLLLCFAFAVAESHPKLYGAKGGAGERNRTAISCLASTYNNHYTTPAHLNSKLKIQMSKQIQNQKIIYLIP